MSQGLFELRTHLAMQNYFALHPHNYYQRWFIAALFCANSQPAMERLTEAKRTAETALHCSLLQAQLLLASATDLNQFWVFEIAPMETTTIYVHEAMAVLNNMLMQVDTVMAGSFLNLGGGSDDL